MSGIQVPELTRKRQDLASRPRASAWVSANAGSGKTFVLSRRVVRLLLDGTDPSRILALTFTKAAAAEMATRVFRSLGAWVTMADEALAAELWEIEGRKPDAARLAMARRLFARALETPGGLKIQTIHGFCEALLHQFPLEANVAGHFSVLDDRVAAELMAEARGTVLHQAEIEPESPLGLALASVITLMSDGGAQNALEELIQSRDAFRRWTVDAGNLENALEELAGLLEISSSDRLSEFDQRFKSDCPFDLNTCLSYSEALKKGAKTDQARADDLVSAARQEDAETFREAWQKIFLTSKLEPRKSLATKKVAANFPAMVEALAAEQARLLLLLDERRKIATFEGTSSLLRLADAVIRHYERAKTARGFLDFEDLVVKTATLLQKSDAAQWVQYKLDQGLDHILVDEAQDTSPRQWDVVTALASEFFVGAGAHERTRTLFAVGDEKQSIYSFQGAVPAYFDAMRRAFSSQADAAEQEFHSVNLQLSFRSTPDVLGAVDDGDIAVLVHDPKIAGQQPAVDQGLRCFLGLIVIAAHHVRALDAQLAKRSARNLAVLRIDNPRFLQGRHDPPRLIGPRLVIRAADRDARRVCFGHAPARGDGDSRKRLRLLANLRRGALGAAGSQHLQRWRLNPVPGGDLSHIGGHRWHADKAGDVFGVDQPQRLRPVPFVHEHDLGAQRHRQKVKRMARRYMEKRRCD